MVDIKELEEALAPKKKGGSKKATTPKTRKKVQSSSQSDKIIYVDGKGNEVEPEDMKEGTTYYLKKEVKGGGNSKRGTGKKNQV